MICSICKRETVHASFLENGVDFEYGVSGVFNYKVCVICGLKAMDPMPSVEEALTYYPLDYHGFEPPKSEITKWLIERNLKQRAQLYKKLIGDKGNILDVGAADGAHFNVWQKEGDWKFYGFEFKDEIASSARSLGRNIDTATMETYDPKGKKFSLIIVNHLLEHVQDPYATVSKAFLLLNKGGYIVGEVPNIASLDFLIFKRFWGGCHWPRHLHQFTPKVLEKMFLDSGYSEVKFHYPLHTGHWALSVQNFLQSFKLTKTKTKNGRVWYYPILLFVFIPINILQKLFGFTGIVGFSARKI